MTHSNRALASTIALAALLPLATPPAVADPLLDEGLTVSLGSFAMDTTTVFRIDGSLGSGDEVDAERDLGLTDQSRFRFDMTWRFANDHKLRMLWFNNDRTAQHVLQRTITIGDNTYPVGTTVTTTVNTDILELAYEYAFWRGYDYEITGSAGLHTVNFFYDVDGLSNTPAEADATGPLPVFGARGMWRFGEAWYLEAQAQFFGLEFGGIRGRLDDYKASLTYMFGDHIGVGAGWNQFTMRITATESEFDGVFQWRYGGPMLFLTGAF